MSEHDDGAPYKVWIFFRDGTHWLSADNLETGAAVECAFRQTQTLGAKLGTTRRVIIEDCLGHTSFEWQFKKGVTFPKVGAKP